MFPKRFTYITPGVRLVGSLVVAWVGGKWYVSTILLAVPFSYYFTNFIVAISYQYSYFIILPSLLNFPMAGIISCLSDFHHIANACLGSLISIFQLISLLLRGVTA